MHIRRVFLAILLDELLISALQEAPAKRYLPDRMAKQLHL
jgi:hypothetical protein